MHDYILSCCSTADLTQEHMQRRDIVYVCFHFELNGVSYFDDLGKSVPFPEFYRRMAAGEMTRTSQVSVGEYEAHFEPFLKEGKDILHLCLSSAISGSYNSAMIAAEDLAARYPDRKIYIVDSLCAASGYGLLMDKLADLRDEGYTIDALRDWAEAHRLEVIHWVCTTDLTYLIRGGRVSKTAGTLGKILDICPLIYVDRKGSLTVRQKIRCKKRALQEIVKHVAAEARGGVHYSGKCYVSHSDRPEDARALADKIEAALPELAEPVKIFDIGTTIGSHTGPGTVVAFFWGEHERDE